MTRPPIEALTVYGPEVLISGLVHSLDRFIAERAGVALRQRFLAMHDYASITRFYGLTGSTTGPHWPLVVDLFDGRPCIASLWSGEDALAALQSLKGATQPSNASPSSIRGNFACDNPVCNLVHVSDSIEIGQAEVSILKARAISKALGVGGEVLQPSDRGALRHSSLWTFTQVLSRLEPAIVAPRVASDASAENAARTALYRLATATTDHPRLRGMIAAFLAGDDDTVGQIIAAGGRLTAWERLLIECGRHSNPLWASRLRLDAIPEVT